MQYYAPGPYSTDGHFYIRGTPLVVYEPDEDDKEEYTRKKDEQDQQNGYQLGFEPNGEPYAHVYGKPGVVDGDVMTRMLQKRQQRAQGVKGGCSKTHKALKTKTKTPKTTQVASKRVVVLPKRIQALLDAIQPWDSPREHTDE
jgi:hypothetical protein